MKKKLARKVMPVTSSNGKQFMNSLDTLFRAQTPAEVHCRLETCIHRANTLTLIRSLYSWVVAPHGLSTVDFSQSEWVRAQVMERWERMINCELARIRTSERLMSDWTVWRALHELSPAATALGEYIRGIRDSFHGRDTTRVHSHFRFGHSDLYLEVHEEILNHPSRTQALQNAGIAA